MYIDIELDKLAKDLCAKYSPNCRDCPDCVAKDNAKALIDKGWRKASDVAREIFEEIEKIIDKHYNKHIFDSDLEDTEKEAVMDFSGDISYDLDSLKISTRRAEMELNRERYKRQCPSCKEVCEGTPLINLLCKCGAKYYYESDIWKDRKTGKEVKGDLWNELKL